MNQHNFRATYLKLHCEPVACRGFTLLCRHNGNDNSSEIWDFLKREQNHQIRSVSERKLFKLENSYKIREVFFWSDIFLICVFALHKIVQLNGVFYVSNVQPRNGLTDAYSIDMGCVTIEMPLFSFCLLSPAPFPLLMFLTDQNRKGERHLAMPFLNINTFFINMQSNILVAFFIFLSLDSIVILFFCFYVLYI